MIVGKNKRCYDAIHEKELQKGIVMLKKILKDSLPTIISLTLSGMYSVVDGLFIGKATGETGLAAINLAWPVTAVITALGIGFGAGGSVLFSHLRGQAKQEESRQTVNNTITLLVVAGITITIIFLTCYQELLRVLGARDTVYKQAEQYSRIIIWGSLFQVLGNGMLPILRNMDMAVSAMISMVTGLITNISINYYFMFEQGLGIRGVAYGTVMAQAVVGCISMILVLKKQKIKLHLEKKISCRTIKNGITAFGMSIAPSVTLIFTNWQCLSYGGNDVVASYAVISYITFPVQYMLCGIGDGTQPLISYYHGAGKKNEVIQIQKIAYILIGIIGLSATLITILLTPYLGIWFGLSGKALKYFESGMRISALAFVLIGFVRFHTAYLNAIMQTKKAVFLTYAESFLVALVFLYLLPLFFGTNGIWIAFPVTAVCMLLIYNIMIR